MQNRHPWFAAVRALIALAISLSALSACDDVHSPGVSSSAASGKLGSAAGAKSEVPAPTVTGPISGGLRGRPWAGAVEALAPLTPYDFVQEEYFFSGTAEARDANGVRSGQQQDYTSRILVQRPRNAAQFNGTVLLEWFNVSVEAELPVLWMLAHDEILREGYAYVGVSAQITGVSASPLALKLWDPLRYAPLRHPGDAYEFDIFSQAARTLFDREGPAPLGPLKAQRVIAGGESQSAALLRVYVNQVHPEHQVIDGALIHTWPGPINEDSKLPVLMFLSESEIGGASSPVGALRAFSWVGMIPALGELLGNIPGAGPFRIQIAERPNEDHRYLRVWEVAGATHGDSDFLEALIAQLTQDLSPLARPIVIEPPLACVLPSNRLSMGRATAAALHQLDRWLRSGKPPESQPRIELQPNGEIARDANGFAIGGIRMPSYAAPRGLNRGDTCPLLGSYVPLSARALAERYASDAAFHEAIEDAAEQNVDEGTLMRPEADLYLDEARTAVPGGSQ